MAGQDWSAVIGQWLQSPQARGLAASLLEASQPGPNPTSMGAALGRGMLYGTQLETQEQNNELAKKKFALDEQQMKLNSELANKRNTLQEKQISLAEQKLKQEMQEYQNKVSTAEALNRALGLIPSNDATAQPAATAQLPQAGQMPEEWKVPMRLPEQAPGLLNQPSNPGILTQPNQGGLLNNQDALKKIFAQQAIASGDFNKAFEILTKQDKAGDKQFDQAAKLRSEYIGQSKDFVTVRDAYSRIQASVEDPSAAGDLAMIFNYMKMLDPGSTVREGEFATAQNSAGVPDMVRAKWNKLLSGERLAPEQRKDFFDRSKKLYGAQSKNYEGLTNEYKRLAKRLGVAPEDVIVDYGVSFPEMTIEEQAIQQQAADPNNLSAFLQEAPVEPKERKPKGIQSNFLFNTLPFR